MKWQKCEADSCSLCLILTKRCASLPGQDFFQAHRWEHGDSCASNDFRSGSAPCRADPRVARTGTLPRPWANARRSSGRAFRQPGSALPCVPCRTRSHWTACRIGAVARHGQVHRAAAAGDGQGQGLRSASPHARRSRLSTAPPRSTIRRRWCSTSAATCTFFRNRGSPFSAAWREGLTAPHRGAIAAKRQDRRRFWH